MAETSLVKIAVLGQKNKAVYKPLTSANAIRLLVLHPGCDEERIICSLVVAEDFADTLPYEAISYCWGEFDAAIEITCDGLPLFVNPSLWNALQRLRLGRHDRIVWVDGVCINQSDTAERNQQVSIMRHIYAHATRVTVWLGSGDEETANTVKAVKDLSDECCNHRFGPESRAQWRDWLRLEQDLRSFTLSVKAVTDESWSMLAPLFACEWFRRIWVIQEIQSCADTSILWGNENLDWCQVLLAASFLNTDQRPRRCGGLWSHTIYPDQHSWDIYAIPQTLFMADQPMQVRSVVPFLEVLHASRAFVCSDPRDRIFSMLQHPTSRRRSVALLEQRRGQYGTREIAHLAIEPDYNLDAAEVYTTVALRSIETSKSLEVLSMSSQTHEPQEGVAAWVPQWDLSNFIDFYPLPTWLYNASRGLECQAHLTFERLVVRGLVVGVVDFTTAVLTMKGMRPRGMGASISTSSFITADTWQDVARIATQDRWRASNLNEDDKDDFRVLTWTEPHFADFAAWLIESKDMTQDFHCTTSIVWCDACNDNLSSPSMPTAAPVVSYTCGICDRGDFDVCHGCYIDKGTRCPRGYKCFLRANIGLWYEHNDTDLQLLLAAAVTGSADRFYKLLRATTNCRTWFASTTGYVGSASHTTQPGDLVCVLFGGRVPFILRPEPDGRYRVIGDCYIDGMMDGKAIAMWEAGELEIEGFTLC